MFFSCTARICSCLHLFLYINVTCNRNTGEPERVVRKGTTGVIGVLATSKKPQPPNNMGGLETEIKTMLEEGSICKAVFFPRTKHNYKKMCIRLRPQGAWPELLPTLLQASTSQEPAIRQSCMEIMETVCDSSVAVVMPMINDFKTVFGAALTDQSVRFRPCM